MSYCCVSSVKPLLNTIIFPGQLFHMSLKPKGQPQLKYGTKSWPDSCHCHEQCCVYLCCLFTLNPFVALDRY